MAISLLLAGATGLVGQHILRQALDDPRVAKVLAMTRRVLPTAPKLQSVVVDFDALPAEPPWWSVDAVICALGTTIRKAGSRAAFRRVDYDYTVGIARIARQHGVPTLGLVSAMGANADSRIFYSRVKGEVEDAVSTLGFLSLTIARPGLIDGVRDEARPAETAALRVVRTLAPILPRRFQANPADAIAAVLLDAATAAVPGRRVIPSEAMTAAR